MEIKKFFKNNRDSLQQFIYKVINPLVNGLVKIGFTPNMVTTTGFLGNIAAAAMFVMAGVNNGAPEYPWLLWGGVVLIVFSLFDMLDGQVARLGSMASTFGAMYDSVLDRYSEMVTLGGICFAMIKTGYEAGALITFVAMVGSIMVSYVRARAEGLDIECKIGFMQRPERVVLTAVAALATGIYGTCSQEPAFDPMWILLVAMGVIAVFANITAFARIWHSKHELQRKEAAEKK
ncbi:MAG: CDP-alcohol phosphatidyltransferase family protein [Muribaculaceae bacterium]|nr:CDP-alcohol phosphatidyltransferase family protein [Muribaculaceae bacterium]